jgi:hypothetical protein
LKHQPLSWRVRLESLMRSPVTSRSWSGPPPLWLHREQPRGGRAGGPHRRDRGLRASALAGRQNPWWQGLVSVSKCSAIGGYVSNMSRNWAQSNRPSRSWRAPAWGSIPHDNCSVVRRRVMRRPPQSSASRSRSPSRPSSVAQSHHQTSLDLSKDLRSPSTSRPSQLLHTKIDVTMPLEANSP